MGTTTFSVTAQDIINSSLRLQGWLDPDGVASGTILTNMQQALNIMIKAWAKDNIHLWCVEELQLSPTGTPLILGQPNYTIGPSGYLSANRPLRIIECLSRNTVQPSGQNTDVTLQRLSRQEYLMLGNKRSTGTPNSFYYDPQLPNGVIYLYDAPDAFAVGSYSILMYSQRQLFDIANLTDTFDFPQEWYQALRWGLAAETALDNQIPESLADRIQTRAVGLLEKCQDWDQEYADIYFQPDMRRGRG